GDGNMCSPRSATTAGTFQRLVAGDERQPVGIDAGVERPLDGVVATRARLERLAAQRQARLGQRLPALAVVAGAAGADKVGPGMAATAGSRHDVVDGQVV